MLFPFRIPCDGCNGCATKEQLRFLSKAHTQSRAQVVDNYSNPSATVSAHGFVSAGQWIFFPPQGINSHPFGRVQHFSFHFSLSSACPGHCCEHLSGDFGVCYPKNGQKWILRSHIIILLLQLLVLSVWTEHSGKFKLCFTLELSRFSCNLLLFWLCKGEIPLQDTNPTPGISSMAQTSRGVRMTAANPPVIKIFQPSVPSL